MGLKFGWDEKKAKSNRHKHQVTFEEASTVFDDPLFITFLDIEHSTDEERYITIGMSSKKQLLLVAPTDNEGQMRIISARKATNYERRFYEEGQ